MKYKFFNKSFSFNIMNFQKNKKLKNNSLWIKVMLLKIIANLNYKININN